MKLCRRKLTFPLLCLAFGLAVFGVSYTLLGQGPGAGSGDNENQGPVGGVDDPPETPAPNPTPGGPGAGEEVGPVGQVTDGDKLFEAIVFDDNQRLQDLLEGGADPNSLTTFGHLPLQLAVSAAESSATAYGKIQLLIQHGANPNQPDSEGITPMDEAAMSGTEAMMTAFLNAGGDANLPTRNGKTPYERAITFGNDGAVAAIKKVLPDHVPADKDSWKVYQMAGIIHKGMREARRHTGKARADLVKKMLNNLVLGGYISAQDAETIYQELKNAKTGKMANILWGPRRDGE